MEWGIVLKQKKKSLHHKIWVFFFLFSLFILLFLWLFQGLFFDKYYELHRSKELSDIASKIEENYPKKGFLEYLDSLSYDTGIEIKIIPKNFDSTEKFAKLTSSQFDTIMMADSSLNKENILVAFLYINSYIGCRPRQDNGSEYENAKDNPEAFYRSISNMANELSMSKDTINQCIEYLTESSDDTPALLIKREVGSVQPDKSKPPQNVPNIYVLNKEGYKQEIEWALSKMLELYKVDEFYPSKSGNYRFENKK